MPDAPKSTQRSRLQAAGWVYLEGWVPPSVHTDRAETWLRCNRAEAERIANTPQERGRPRKEPKP